MGDDAVIIEGVDSPASREALFSTVHGAGTNHVAHGGERAIRESWQQTNPPGRTRQARRDDEMGCEEVELRGGDLDEAPQAYRRLRMFWRRTRTIRVCARCVLSVSYGRALMSLIIQGLGRRTLPISPFW